LFPFNLRSYVADYDKNLNLAEIVELLKWYENEIKNLQSSTSSNGYPEGSIREIKRVINHYTLPNDLSSLILVLAKEYLSSEEIGLYQEKLNSTLTHEELRKKRYHEIRKLKLIKVYLYLLTNNHHSKLLTKAKNKTMNKNDLNYYQEPLLKMTSYFLGVDHYSDYQYTPKEKIKSSIQTLLYDYT
jgi:hypothetical protein